MGLASFKKPRNLITLAVWVATLLIMIPSIILLPARVYLILFSTLCSTAVTVWVFCRYSSKQKFPKTAYLNIGLTMFFSLASIGILATDVGFTLYYEHENDIESQVDHHDLMYIFWNILYWGNII